MQIETVVFFSQLRTSSFCYPIRPSLLVPIPICPLLHSYRTSLFVLLHCISSRCLSSHHFSPFIYPPSSPLLLLFFLSFLFHLHTSFFPFPFFLLRFPIFSIFSLLLRPFCFPLLFLLLRPFSFPLLFLLLSSSFPSSFPSPFPIFIQFLPSLPLLLSSPLLSSSFFPFRVKLIIRICSYYP